MILTIITRRWRILLALVLMATCLLAIAPKLSALGTGFFDNTSPCDTSSCYSSGPPASGAFVSLLVGETRFVQKTGVYAVAYFTTSSGTVTIYGGNYCPAQPGNPDYIQTGDYYDINGWPANGRAIVNFNVSGHVVQGYKYAGTDAADCGATKVVTVTGMPRDPATGLYVAPISVSYIDGVANNYDGVQDYFSLAETGAGTYAIGQKGGTSGYEVTAEETTGPSNIDYDVRFGADCTVTANKTASLYYYDIDNDGGGGAQLNGKITMQLYDDTDGVQLLAWTPPTNNNAASTQSFTIKPGHSYRWKILNVYTNNTIQYSTPYDGIYYYKPCSWRLSGQSTVSSLTAAPGDTVTFTHKVTNVGGLKMDRTFNTTVPWTAGNAGNALGNETENKLDPGASIARTYDFPIPPNAVPGTKYCQQITYAPQAFSDNSTGKSTQACVTVVIGAPQATKFVDVTPFANNVPDIEPGDSTTVPIGVSVSGFPATTDWSYQETAIQAAPSAVAPTQSSYTASSAYYDTPSAVKGVCGRYRSGTCVAWYWYCPATGTMPGGPTATAPTCPARYKHTCQSYSYINASASGSCNDKWTCPSPNNSVVQYRSSAPTNCNVFRCQYSGALNYSTSSPSPSQCDYRCSRGTGSPAPLASGSKYANGDENCYLQPTFSVTCTWSSAVSSPPPQTFSVNGNGSYCLQSVPVQGITIGTTVCVTVSTSGGFWTANTPTKIGSYQKYVWGFNYGTSSGCSKVVGKPYVKFYGSDVMVGGGVGATSTSCSVNTGAQIRAQNNISGSYSGAGVQYAARALAAINGFASAQQTANATSSSGTNPRKLTFANTTGSYGGQFSGGAPACVGFIDRLKANNPGITPIKLDQTIGGQVVAPGSKTTIYVAKNDASDSPSNQQHDVYITGNIVYAPWATISQIPQFQLVVEGGDIFIASNVTQLDGLYVALPKDGVGGHIYTCANGMRSIPTESFATCKQQLVVNGSFVAKQVQFLRGCGSLRESLTNEPTVYSGSSDVTTCGPVNHAAEVFNYSPEEWIRGVLGPIPDTYDAVSSLPPIL